MKGNLNVYITRTITDTKTGKVIKKYRKRQSKSFVKAFMQMLEVAMAHAWTVTSNAVTIKDTANADKSVDNASGSPNYYFGVECPANLTTYGILIGTGTTPPAVADYTMETLIAHGTAATQMSYGAVTVHSATVSGSDMEMTITRAMVNNSGGSITVKEVGIALSTIVATQFNFLILHDAVDDAVADGQTYTVTYTLTTTV